MREVVNGARLVLCSHGGFDELWSLFSKCGCEEYLKGNLKLRPHYLWRWFGTVVTSEHAYVSIVDLLSVVGNIYYYGFFVCKAVVGFFDYLVVH